MLWQQSDTKLRHLSTLLCGTHRVEVLQWILDQLQDGKPCLVVSTQVVEAGVDLDFPLVLRALGPLSSIVQAAGRCNRNDKRNDGHVIIFRPREGGEPFGVPKLARQITESLYMRGQLDPNDPDSFIDYYKRLLNQINPDREKIQEFRQSFEYREVAEKFKMIPDDTIALLVRYSTKKDETERRTELKKIDGLVDDLMNQRRSARTLLHQLQPYIVNLFRSNALTLQRQYYRGRSLVELIGDENSNIGIWNGEYDKVRGLVVPTSLGLDQLVQ
jgi:CRISPR-associated endonuclease/helicase Cas3